MDKRSAQNIHKLAVGLANGVLQLVGYGIIAPTQILQIGSRDLIAEAFEAAIREVVESLQD